MNLSERATRYLNNLKRDEDLFSNEEETINYCKKQNFPLTKTLLNVQTNFSGYKLTIRNDRGHGFLLQLFAKYEIDENRDIEFYYFGETYIVEFGEHDTAQFRFYITDAGELCTLGQQDGDLPNIICSSIEKYIEQYALKDELALQKEDSYYRSVLNNEVLTRRLNLSFAKIDECSDKYSQWFTDGQLTIAKGTWLHQAEFYIKVYGQKQKSIKRFLKSLKTDKIIL